MLGEMFNWLQDTKDKLNVPIRPKGTFHTRNHSAAVTTTEEPKSSSSLFEIKNFDAKSALSEKKRLSTLPQLHKRNVSSQIYNTMESNATEPIPPE